MRGGGAVLAVDNAATVPLETFLSSQGLTLPPTPFFLLLEVPVGSDDSRHLLLSTAAESISKAIAASPAGVPFAVVLDFSSLELPGSREDTIRDIAESVARFKKTTIPIVLQLSVLTAPDLVSDIVDACEPDALVAAPSVPWESLSEEVRTVFFRRKESPFTDASSVFGKYVVPLVCEWVRQVRRQGVATPIVAGGVISRKEIIQLKEAGVSALGKDSLAAILRPWNVYAIRARAQKLFS